MNKTDMKLYEVFQSAKNTMCRNDLYYALLDWTDQHPELYQEELKKTDKFLVRYILNKNDFYDKFFTVEDYSNPYKAARTFIGEMLEEHDDFEYQFEILPNPYRTGEDRMGKIIMTNME